MSLSYLVIFKHMEDPLSNYWEMWYVMLIMLVEECFTINMDLDMAKCLHSEAELSHISTVSF